MLLKVQCTFCVLLNICNVQHIVVQAFVKPLLSARVEQLSNLKTAVKSLIATVSTHTGEQRPVI